MVTETLLNVKSRPILFSAEMVRAILAGRKTQTRRIVDRLSGVGPVTWFEESRTPGYSWAMRDRTGCWNEFRNAELIARCPYGCPGDRLWGREAVSFSVGDRMTDRPYAPIPKAHQLDDGRELRCWYAADANRPSWAETAWHPSIHQPKWASRIWLSIVDVRIERLADITEADAYSEGVTVAENHQGSPDFDFRNDARVAYRQLWERINGPGSWSINPYVWVIEFKRLKGGPVGG